MRPYNSAAVILSFFSSRSIQLTHSRAASTLLILLPAGVVEQNWPLSLSSPLNLSIHGPKLVMLLKNLLVPHDRDSKNSCISRIGFPCNTVAISRNTHPSDHMSVAVFRGSYRAISGAAYCQVFPVSETVVLLLRFSQSRLKPKSVRRTRSALTRIFCGLIS